MIWIKSPAIPGSTNLISYLIAILRDAHVSCNIRFQTFLRKYIPNRSLLIVSVHLTWVTNGPLFCLHIYIPWIQSQPMRHGTYADLLDHGCTTVRSRLLLWGLDSLKIQIKQYYFYNKWMCECMLAAIYPSKK